MTVPFDALLQPNQHRLLVEAPLRPVQGARFQPTGFPDLGAAVFDAPDGRRLLVESAQSMANRLESLCWDSSKQDLVPELVGISYVRVERPDGTYLTSSITEAHRLNSPYILEGKDKSVLDALKKDTAGMEEGNIDRRRLAEIVFGYDAFCLLHGLFLAKSELAGGRLRIERALSSFIEAKGVEVAASGGVKNDHVNPSGDPKKGFGNVPFQRDEYTAAEIKVYFSLDLTEIRAFGLRDPATRLLLALALYKITGFLGRPMRLRTACDLELAGPPVVKRPDGFELPAFSELQKSLPAWISECKDLFRGERGVTRVKYQKA
jgi:CRISPR-associated protein Csb1